MGNVTNFCIRTNRCRANILLFTRILQIEASKLLAGCSLCQGKSDYRSFPKKKSFLFCLIIEGLKKRCAQYVQYRL